MNATSLPRKWTWAYALVFFAILEIVFSIACWIFLPFELSLAHLRYALLSGLIPTLAITLLSFVLLRVLPARWFEFIVGLLVIFCPLATIIIALGLTMKLRSEWPCFHRQVASRPL